LELDVSEIRGIIFDMDGTLADTMPSHYEAWSVILERYGLEMSEDRFYALGGWPTERVADLLIGESGRQLDAQQISVEKESLFAESLHLVQPIEHTTAVARKHRGSIPLAVATGATRDICELILKQLEIRDWFDAVVCADEVERHKPNPDVFLEAARRLGVAPEHCVVYEDTDPGLEAARRAGMAHIDVRQFYTPRRVT
jgi:beta-phosphoglucomutase family hydrolase